MSLPKPGDTLDDRSRLSLREGDENGRALLEDKWGIYYVTDEKNELHYVGGNAIAAEVEYTLPSFEIDD